MVLHNIAIDVQDKTWLPDPMDEILAQHAAEEVMRGPGGSDDSDDSDEDELRTSSIDGTESKTREARERRQRGIALRNDIADYLLA